MKSAPIPALLLTVLLFSGPPASAEVSPAEITTGKTAGADNATAVGGRDADLMLLNDMMALLGELNESIQENNSISYRDRAHLYATATKPLDELMSSSALASRAQENGFLEYVMLAKRIKNENRMDLVGNLITKASNAIVLLQRDARAREPETIMRARARRQRDWDTSRGEQTEQDFSRMKGTAGHYADMQRMDEHKNFLLSWLYLSITHGILDEPDAASQTFRQISRWIDDNFQTPHGRAEYKARLLRHALSAAPESIRPTYADLALALMRAAAENNLAKVNSETESVFVFSRSDAQLVSLTLDCYRNNHSQQAAEMFMLLEQVIGRAQLSNHEKELNDWAIFRNGDRSPVLRNKSIMMALLREEFSTEFNGLNVLNMLGPDLIRGNARETGKAPPPLDSGSWTIITHVARAVADFYPSVPQENQAAVKDRLLKVKLGRRMALFRSSRLDSLFDAAFCIAHAQAFADAGNVTLSRRFAEKGKEWLDHQPEGSESHRESSMGIEFSLRQEHAIALAKLGDLDAASELMVSANRDYYAVRMAAMREDLQNYLAKIEGMTGDPQKAVIESTKARIQKIDEQAISPPSIDKSDARQLAMQLRSQHLLSKIHRGDSAGVRELFKAITPVELRAQSIEAACRIVANRLNPGMPEYPAFGNEGAVISDPRVANSASQEELRNL